MKKNIWFPVFLFLSCLLFFAKSARAKEFTFDYDVAYNVSEQGITKVLQKITVTNLITDFYAENFTFTINSEQIERVEASDALGPLVAKVTKNKGQTEIKIIFKDKIVGAGKQFTFNLNYDSLDIASKKGRIWEIIIPGIEKKSDIGSYITRLHVPESFGKAAYFSPPLRKGGVWTLDDLAGRGITAAFGDTQVFTFNLLYYLDNPSAERQTQEITLPPDTAFQRVILERLSNSPENVVVDGDGNWLARFTLEPKTSKKIFAEGYVLLSITPRPEFKHTLSSSQSKKLTEAQNYWEQTEEITKKAKELQDPQSIYNYVVTTLSYDYNRIQPGVKRLGAKEVFDHPDSAICMEYSDLFVALARAAGIPAREIHGYAYTTNSRLQPLSLVTDVLHAWTEYYDPKDTYWHPVDTTWGSTTKGVDYFSKLDFDHIAFAVLGNKSDYPYPAGSFRTEGSTKDVFIEFAKDLPEIPQPTYEVTFELPRELLSGFETNGKMVIKNTGRVLFQPLNMSVKSQFPIEYDHTLLTDIPPYGHVVIPFQIHSQFSFVPNRDTLKATVDGNEFSKSVTYLPFYFTVEFLGGVIVVVGVVLFIKSHVAQHPPSRAS